MKDFLKPGERIDDLQLKGLKIIQNPEWFCFGIDAVLLANFAQAHIKKGTKVVDLGCGTGVIAILLAGKTQASSIIGIEIQNEVAEMADRSIQMNGIQDRVRIINADLKEAPDLVGISSVDVVVANPPYKAKGCGIVNPSDKKAIARHEILCTLEDVIKSAGAVLKPRGKLFMVHRPDRLVDIMWYLRNYGLEPKRLRFVYPRVEEPPILILIEGLKDGNPYMKIEKPLIIFDGNEYTEEVKKMYENK